MFIDSARRRVIEAVAAGVCALGSWLSPAFGQIGMPEVVITPVAHQGDPAPGIPGATLDYILTPQIDAAGNVLFMAFLAGPGIDSSNYMAVFYGPPDGLEKIAWMSDPAPDMGGEVIIAHLLGSSPYVSETGWLTFNPTLAGPGIVAGVNDVVVLAGPPGDIRRVLQGSDEAPGLEPGVVIDVSNGGLGAQLSDNATLLVYAYLAGPGVDYTNDRAYWTGTRDDLHLAWRSGMPAPGTEPGVNFAWADSVVFNDAGQMALRGGLVEGGTVDDTNSVGYWACQPGGLQLIARGGEQAWGVEEDVVYHSWGTTSPALNSGGDIGYWMLLAEQGLPPDQDQGLWYWAPEGPSLLGRYGDAAPDVSASVELVSIGSQRINQRQEIFYRVKYGGPAIDGSNAWAMYFGSYDDAQLTLRDADAAPRFPTGTTLARVVGVPALAAMNDQGDVVAPTEIAGPDVPDDKKVVLWLRHRLLEQWVPILRSGAAVEGRTVWAQGASDIGDGYNNKTGGSDGQPQSLNDAGQLAIQLQFTDGTHGVYRIEPLVFGDSDGDADVDLTDWAAVQSCLTGVEGGTLGTGCEFFDFDWDGDVDLKDFAVFQRLFASGA